MTCRRTVLSMIMAPLLAAGLGGRARASFSSAAASSRSFTSDHAVLIWQDGTIVFEDGNVTKNYPVASISKSLTGLVLGKLMDEGKFGPSSFLHQYLPTDWVGSDTRKRSIKLWHAMTMCSGLQPHDAPGKAGYDPLALKTVANPAVHWAYASAPWTFLGSPRNAAQVARCSRCSIAASASHWGFRRSIGPCRSAAIPELRAAR